MCTLNRALIHNLLPVLAVLILGGLLSKQQAYGQADYRLAQLKSQRMAQVGSQRLARAKSPYSIAPIGMRHVYPLRRPVGVRLEGVGFSPSSPADAIRNACHYGQRPIRTSAVVHGRDGYYATVFYR